MTKRGYQCHERNNACTPTGRRRYAGGRRTPGHQRRARPILACHFFLLARHRDGICRFRTVWPGGRYGVRRRVLSRSHTDSGAVGQLCHLLRRLCRPSNRCVGLWLDWRSQRPPRGTAHHGRVDGRFYHADRADPPTHKLAFGRLSVW